jgi:hypothetical protein
MPSVRIYQKKQIRLDRLSFPQAQMFKVGNVGVATVKNRMAAAQGPTDSSAKPLTKRYAIWKTKIGNLALPVADQILEEAGNMIDHDRVQRRLIVKALVPGCKPLRKSRVDLLSKGHPTYPPGGRRR